MVKLIIHQRPVEVAEGTTLLDAAAQLGIRIPTLCYLKDINEVGACRVCLVEVEGVDRLVAACNNVCEEGMVVRTDTARVRAARRGRCFGRFFNPAVSAGSLPPASRMSRRLSGREEMG